MADTFALTGGYTTTPSLSPLSAEPEIEAILDESVVLANKLASSVVLTADAAQAINLGDMAAGGVTVIIFKAIGGYVTARVTSASGNQQLVPIDSLMILMSSGRPITAIDLIRQAGTQVTVKYMLGQKA